MTLPRARGRIGRAAAALAGALAVIAVYGIFIEPAGLREETVSADLSAPSDSGTPLRIALLADLHLPTFLGDEDKLWTALEKGDPDVVLVAGDVRNHRRSYAAGEAFLNRVGSRWPTAVVMGDADQCSWRGQCIACRARYGGKRELPFRILRNESWILPDLNLFVHGVDDPTTDRDEPEPEPPPGFRSILLVHSTHKLSEARMGRYDLVLAGNTHGGQLFFLKPFLSRLDPSLDGRYPGGEYRIGGTLLVVSRGTGTSRMPMRLGVPPEMTWIDVD